MKIQQKSRRQRLLFADSTQKKLRAHPIPCDFLLIEVLAGKVRWDEPHFSAVHVVRQHPPKDNSNIVHMNQKGNCER